jgi:hypothetical protein
VPSVMFISDFTFTVRLSFLSQCRSYPLFLHITQQKLFIGRSHDVVFSTVNQKSLLTQSTQLHLQSPSGYSKVGDVGTILI